MPKAQESLFFCGHCGDYVTKRTFYQQRCLCFDTKLKEWKQPFQLKQFITTFTFLEKQSFQSNSLRKCSLVPRPRPDFISQPWRGLGTRLEKMQHGIWKEIHIYADLPTAFHCSKNLLTAILIGMVSALNIFAYGHNTT